MFAAWSCSFSPRWTMTIWPWHAVLLASLAYRRSCCVSAPILSPRESQRGSHPWVASCGRASRGVLGSSLVLELFLMGWVGSRAEAEPGGQQGPRPPNAAEIFLIPLCGQAHSPACSVEDFRSPSCDFSELEAEETSRTRGDSRRIAFAVSHRTEIGAVGIAVRACAPPAPAAAATPAPSGSMDAAQAQRSCGGASPG